MSELGGLGLPDNVASRLTDVTNPNQTHIGRLYTLESGDDFTAVAQRPLREFMLAPDPQQRTVIAKELNAGPILARGGPGTGKTLIGLYRLKRILSERATESLFDNRKPVFEFLSYTNALVNTSKELFRSLFASRDDVEVRFSTLDRIVTRELADYFAQNGQSLGAPLSAGTLEFRLRQMTLKKMLAQDKTRRETRHFMFRRGLGLISWQKKSPKSLKRMT